MNTRSKSTLFLIEQLIVVAVFAICAVACISILTSSFFFAHDASDTSRALIEAQSSAEIFRATGGDFQVVADIMGGTFSDQDANEVAVNVFFDRHWDVITYQQPGGFVLRLELDDNFSSVSPVMAQLSVSRAIGDSLVSFPVAAR